MNPVKQKFRHDPKNGVWGDCERAAWATVLNLDIEAVPHFFDGGCSSAEAVRREREFERTLGLYHVSMPFLADNGLEAVLKAVNHNNPEAVYLLCGESRSGCNHTVVCRGAQIVHDPSLNDAGIIGPCDDGFYWVTVFTHSPAQGIEAQRVETPSAAPSRSDESPVREANAPLPSAVERVDSEARE